MNFFAAVKLAIQLIPILASIITAIQAAFPNTAGADKLNIAKAMLQTANDVAPDFAAEFETVWTIATPLIAAMVDAFKSNGTIPPKV